MHIMLRLVNSFDLWTTRLSSRRFLTAERLKHFASLLSVAGERPERATCDCE